MSTDPRQRKDRKAATRDALLSGVGASLVAMFCWVTAVRLPALSEPYWAPIAAVVVLYPDVESTWTAGFQRFVGTAIGSLVGWGCAAWWHGNVALYGLGVMLAVAACHGVRCVAAARLSAVAVTVITIIPHHEPPHLVALFRFIEVSYGVGCAMAYTAIVETIFRQVRRASPEA
jgi:uncharacterized membrane protein YgaE (UPF0421/DUF939 family)